MSRIVAGAGILAFAVSVVCAQHANLELAQAPQPPPAYEVSAEYRIGNGDVLQISVWGEPELNKTVTVRPDGRISLPLIDEVQIAGLTPSEAQSTLDRRLARYIRHPQTTVIVSEVRSSMVYVTGNVQHPGAYPLAGPLNTVQLIARAGGLAERGTPKHVYVLRDGSHRLNVNYKAVLEGRRGNEDVQLLPGDTVVVP